MSRFVIAIGAVALVLAFTSDGSAQPVADRFEHVRLVVKMNEAITVRLMDGHTVRGRVLSASPSSLVLEVKGQPRRLDEQDVSLISHRVRDSPWDSALIAGFTPAIIAAGFTHELGTATSVKAGLLWGGAFGAVGAGIDALFKKREVVYRSGRKTHVGFVPLWDRQRHGLAASVRF